MKKTILTFGSLVAYVSIASAQIVPINRQILLPVVKPQTIVQQAPVTQPQPVVVQQPVYQPQPTVYQPKPTIYQQPVMMQAPVQPTVQPVIIQEKPAQITQAVENDIEKREGIYFGFALRGISTNSHAKIVDNNLGGSWTISENDMELETGGGISLALGYEVGNARIELAYTSDMNYEENDTANPNELLQNELYASTIGVNLFYGFNSTGKVSPYVGLGFGQTTIEYTSNELGFQGSWDDSVLTYQGMVGLDFHLSQYTTLSIGYTYKKSAENAELKGVMDDSWGNKLDMELDYTAHIGEVGFRFRF